MKIIESTKNIFLFIAMKIDSLFKVIKKDNDWSATSFCSVLVVVIPLLIWAIMCFISLSVLAMPESIVALIIVGITGKVFSQNNKIKKEKVDG